MNWTRFWRLFKRDLDPFFIIIICIVVGTLRVLGVTGSDLSTLLSLMLVVLPFLAISTIRDRETRVYKEEHASKPFEQQSAACRYLIDYVSEHGAKEAVLLQYSCATSFDLACVLLDQGAHVTIYVQHEDVPAKLGSQGQKERIKLTIRRLQGHVRGNPNKVYHLKLCKYRALGTVSAINIDNRVLSMGSYTYEQVDPAKDRHYGTDTISISGHDRGTVVAFEGSDEFKTFNKTFHIIENEYQHNVEEVQL